MSEATNKTDEKMKKQTEYSKEQILMSNRYKNRKDLINVLLEDGKYYSTDTVDKMIEKFMKGKVS